MVYYIDVHAEGTPVRPLEPVSRHSPVSAKMDSVSLSSPVPLPPAPKVGTASRTSPPSATSGTRGRVVTPDKTPVKRKKSLIQTIIEKLRQSPSNNYSTVSDRFFCRICHEGADSSFGQSGEEETVEIEPLISPCKCSGSVGLIHRSCLEKWLSTANGDHCEICGHKFNVTAKAKPFKQWLLGARFGETHRNLTADLVCFFVLTPLATISAYLCGAGAAHYLHTPHQTMEAIGLMVLACFLCIIYIVWVSLSLRFHLHTFREWQKNNQEIRLVEVVSDEPEQQQQQLHQEKH